jgi:transcriptional regulator with XRE-family HTH domain
MNFNKTIKKTLKKKGISQRQLSQDLNINEGQLSHYLKHGKKLSFQKNVIRILDYLGIDLRVE